MVSSAPSRASTPANVQISGLNSGPTPSLSTLRSHGYPLMYSHARLASGWPASLGRAGLATCGTPI